MLVHGVMERVLDQTAQHVAAHLLAEHALEHAPRRLARTEPGKPRLPADLRERAIDLGLHGRARRSRPASACGSVRAPRPSPSVVRVRGSAIPWAHPWASQTSRPRLRSRSRCERGDSNPHGCPRDPKSRASASSATLASYASQGVTHNNGPPARQAKLGRSAAHADGTVASDCFSSTTLPSGSRQ